jgi:hypothetical protein
MYRLKTEASEVAQALLLVMRRGSLRAAEEITGHKYETISVWLKRAASHAAAITQVLANDLHLSQVEIDEFWSFVQKKTVRAKVAGEQRPPSAPQGRRDRPGAYGESESA